MEASTGTGREQQGRAKRIIVIKRKSKHKGTAESCHFFYTVGNLICICVDCDVKITLGQPTVKGYTSVRHKDRPLAN